MTDFNQIADRYIACWNEQDPARRRTAVDALWASGGRYVDPLADVTGAEQIDATIAAVQAQFPTFRFRLAGPIDAHHDQCRFTWELGPEDGEAHVAGFDVALADGTGKLHAVHGFLDRVPTA